MPSNEVQFFVRLGEVLRNQGFKEDEINVNDDNQMNKKEPSFYSQRSSHKNRIQVKGRHPHESDIRRLEAILRKLQYECIGYKFTVYRCAIKIVTLQKILMTAFIPYKLIIAVLERHNIQDADVNLMIPPFQLTSLLHDVYFASERFGFFKNMASLALLKSSTIMLANLLWDIFDPHRRHSISLMEIKVTFLLLCKLYSSDNIITELFKVISNGKTKHITKLHFESLVNIFVRLFAYIGEADAYGAHNIPLVMEQCFIKDHLSLGLSSPQFENIWMKKKTRFLIYANLVALVKRIENTEDLVHSNECAGSCKSRQIIGIRFKCQICKEINLCLQCFAAGYQNETHNSSHRMFEVFDEDTPNKKLSHYLSKLCCNIRFGCKRGSDQKTNDDNCHNNTESTIYNDNAQLIDTTTTIPGTSFNRVTSTTQTDCTDQIITTVKKTSAFSSNPVIYYIPEQNSKIKINTDFIGLSNTAHNAINVSERLQNIIDKLLLQNAKLEKQLQSIQTSTQDEITIFLRDHQAFLMNIIGEMRNFGFSPKSEDYPSALSNAILKSSPQIFKEKRDELLSKNKQQHEFNFNTDNQSETILSVNPVSDHLTHSINGADINRSYLDANKSNYSMRDLSCWFSQYPPNLHHLQNDTAVIPSSYTTDDLVPFTTSNPESNTTFAHRDTDMSNFKSLLSKVKEIVDDSYSDNTELSAATQNLENVLDSIIHCEEKIRQRHHN